MPCNFHLNTEDKECWGCFYRLQEERTRYKEALEKIGALKLKEAYRGPIWAHTALRGEKIREG